MNETIRRWIYCLLITGSVIVTPLVGILGPFDNGSQTNSLPREYFVPAGYVVGTVWMVNYLGLAAYGLWQALPGQRNNLRVRRTLPWLAATAFANTIWMAFASSVSAVPWTVPTLVFMEVTAWVAYFRLGIQQAEAASTTEKWLHAASASSTTL